MKFNREDLEDICFGDVDYKDFEIIEDEDWIDDGKYSYKRVIFKHKGKFYSVDFSRSGSYFSDYEYDFEYMDTECPEVEQVEVIKKVWIVKKEKK